MNADLTDIKLENLMYAQPDPNYFNEDFRNELEAHVSWLKNHPTTTLINNSDFARYKYQFDMYGLFRYLSIPEELHYIVMRMNGYTTPTANTEKTPAFLVPDARTVAQIMNYWNSSKKI